MYAAMTAVSERAVRSTHLLEGLSRALRSTGRDDLASIAELAREEAAAAACALRLCQAQRRARHDRALLADLRQLAHLSGPEGPALAARIARRVATR